MGDIRECYAEWLKEFISSLTVHREHKSAECFSLCFLLPVPSVCPGLHKIHAEFEAWRGVVGVGWGVWGAEAANSHCLGNMFRKHPNCLCNM